MKVERTVPLRFGYIAAILALFGAAASAVWVTQLLGTRPIARADFEALYTPPPAARPPERVFHIGHSLVGRDMPAMFAQLSGHQHESQLGWGSSLRQHWDPDVPINGFEVENAHARYRDAHEAVGSGDYDVVVVTEALGYRNRRPWREPQAYLRRWATKAWDANPDTRFYLYATWDNLSKEGDWVEHINRDVREYWEDQMLLRTLAYRDVTQPIYVIPGGPVMAAVARAAEAEGGIGPISDRHALFSDDIHFNDYGAYLMALTHYAVLYAKSPVGLPHALMRANGTPAEDVGAEAARRMQEIVWEVVTSYAPTGVKS